LDKKGQDLLFVALKGKFKVLADDEVKQLNSKNRTSYLTSKALFEEALADEPVESVASLIGAADVPSLINTGYGIKLNSEAGNASDRVRLNVKDGRTESDFSWLRPEDVEDYMKRGYEVVTSGVETLARRELVCIV